jgi:hypothetical protein
MIRRGVRPGLTLIGVILFQLELSPSGGAPLPAGILAGLRHSRAPMNYDSLYPTFWRSMQAGRRLGRRLRPGDSTAMPYL